MYATVRLLIFLSAVALCVSTPYYGYPQQRQLFYPMVPQYYSAPLAPTPLHYRQFYYAPQTAANLVAPVPPVLRYPSPLVAPSKQVLYYPGASPYLGNLVLAGDEGSGNQQGWLGSIASIFGEYFQSPQPAEGAPPAASGETGATGGAPAASPEKVEQPSNSEGPTKVENEKEGEGANPTEEAKVKGAPQKYVLVGQPQFFGSYGLQRLNPAAVIPSANHGAVSSYLLLKNFPGVKFGPQFPPGPQVQQVPQQVGDAELIPAGQPGSAALGYQRLLQTAQASRQQKEYDDTASVSVEAAQKDATPENDKPDTEGETEKEPEDEETGTFE